MDLENNNPHKNKVHKVLAHSYSFLFLFFLMGIFFDMIFNIPVFNNSFSVLLGLIFIFFAPFLILWAQHTGRNFKKDNLNTESFLKGPYLYTRNPTHLGLSFLMLGFGLLMNSFFIIIFTLVAYLFSRFIFLYKQDKILTEKYGNYYIEYKKIVKF